LTKFDFWYIFGISYGSFAAAAAAAATTTTTAVFVTPSPI